MSADEIVCREFVELATDYLEGAMPDETLELVEEHLAMCDWCRDYLDQIETTAHVVGAAADGPDAAASGGDARRRLLGAFRDAHGGRRRAVIAYKFLCAGGVGPFSGYRWPLPRDGGAGRVGGRGARPVLCRRRRARVPRRRPALVAAGRALGGSSSTGP